MEKLLLFEIIGVFVIFILGSLFHFLYKYGGKKIWMAIISPVNESIWEHLKIAFYPFLIYAVFELFLLDLSLESFIWAKTVGVVVLIVAILLIEVIYPRFTKKNILFIDLIVFFLTIALAQYVGYMIFINTLLVPPISISLSILLSIAMIIAYVTFYPPKRPLFRDSLTGKYGI
ncbi:MAG TPA: DUF6512 family protein [Candidatus Dojkabacteria bacterium]|nr:DUF6512 family protein [Candidatus Dojkabacteria bacterium]